MALLNKTNLDVVVFAGRLYSASLRALDVVLVTDGHTVATDGTQLAIVSTPNYSTEDFARSKDFSPSLKYETTIDANAASGLAKALPRPSRGMGAPGCVAVEVTRDGNAAKVRAATLGVGGLRISTVGRSGGFPDYKAVFPERLVTKQQAIKKALDDKPASRAKAKPTRARSATVVLNAAQIFSLFDFIRRNQRPKPNGFKLSKVYIRLWGEEMPAQFVAEVGDDGDGGAQVVEYLAMPAMERDPSLRMDQLIAKARGAGQAAKPEAAAPAAKGGAE